MRHAEMPIFTRTFDLLVWLLPLTNHFPRAHRHTVTGRLTGAALDLRERLEEANLQQGDRLVPDVSARVRSWLNHTRYGNTVGLRKAVLRDAARMAERRAVTRERSGTWAPA